MPRIDRGQERRPALEERHPVLVEGEDDLLALVQQLARERHGGNLARAGSRWPRRPARRHRARPRVGPMDPEELLHGLDDAQRAGGDLPRHAAGAPRAGRIRQDAGAHAAHRPPRGHRRGRPPPRARHHLHPQGRRRAGRPPRVASACTTTPPRGTFHAVAWGTLRTRWSDQGRPAAHPAGSQGPAAAGARAGRARARTSARVAADLATEIEWAKARMVTPDTYVEAVAAASRRPGLRPRHGGVDLRRLRAPQAAGRPGRLRRPARAVRPGARGRRSASPPRSAGGSATSSSTSSRT